jgi:predicted 2-oxoglutarate/Fe(II)-dependent dioxygenase YbiX
VTTTHGSPISVGDPLPSIEAPTHEGDRFVLEHDAAGVPLVLVVGHADTPSGAGSWGLVIGVGRSPVAGAAFTLADDGSIAGALSAGRAAVIVAGADHRVVAVGDASVLAGLGPGDDGRRAPVLELPAVIDADLCAMLIERAATRLEPSKSHRDGGDGTAELVIDPTRKARLDHVLEDGADVDRVVASLQRRLLPWVARSFSFRPVSFERPKVVRYPADGGWFAPHRDNVTPDAAHRRVAVTINLDDGYTGGELRFPEFGPSTYRPAPGAAIVFGCGLLHEVTPVTSGDRHALITFLW